MKSIHTALALCCLAATVPALADEPANPLSFNASVTTDYRFRGISQTRLKPALQVGADYAAANGFYIGTWASNIKWIKDAGGDSNVELDVYGGYKTDIGSGLTMDLGALRYIYAGNQLSPSANTTEVYAALALGPVTAKYSHSVTNLFGFADSKGSGYLEASGTFDLGQGFSLTPHVGHQTVRHTGTASYTDYALTLNKDYAGLTFGLAAIGTNNDTYIGAGKNLGKNGLVLSVKKNF